MRTMDAYIRVSRVMGREGESFLSPGIQRDTIERWAEANRVKIAGWHEDLDVSGGKMSRPALDVIMRRIEAGQTGGIIVSKLDRLARDVAGGLALVARLDTLNAEFVAVENNVDRTDPNGRLMFNILASIAQWHLDVTRREWNTTVGLVVERGGFAAHTPFGYAKRADAVLVPDPVEAPFLVGIFERRAKGETWQSIADWLNASDVPPRRASHWTRGTVKDITMHEVYLGVSAKQGFRNETAHEPLISRGLWEQVRNIHNIVPTATNGDGYLLAGLLRCAACSFTMSGTTTKPRGKPGVRQYVCRRRHGSGTCPAPANISAALVEPYAEQAFLDHVGRLEMEPVTAAPALADAQRELADALAEEIAWAEQFSTTFSAEAYAAGARKRTERVTAAKAAVDAARFEASGVELPDAAELVAWWPELTSVEKRRLMSAGLDFFAVDKGRGVDGRIRLFARGEGPDGLPRKGYSAPIRAL